MANTTFEQVMKMRRGTNAYELFKFPYTNDEIAIAIRVLTQTEIKMATNDGRRKADTDLYQPTQLDYNDYGARELLLKAVYTVQENGESDLTEPFFKSSVQVGELTMDEVSILLQHYNEVQEKYSPLDKVETEDEIWELIEDVKKKSLRGTSLSTYTLRVLVEFLVKNSTTLQKDSDSISSHSRKQLKS